LFAEYIVTQTVYQFGWEANRARTNLSKHRVAFSTATSVFRDTLALTIFVDHHCDDEDRWVVAAPGLKEIGG
jgi:uncharacterized DUF497 family protein